jgi:hypothetical protein
MQNRAPSGQGHCVLVDEPPSRIPTTSPGQIIKKRAARRVEAPGGSNIGIMCCENPHYPKAKTKTQGINRMEDWRDNKYGLTGAKREFMEALGDDSQLTATSKSVGGRLVAWFNSEVGYSYARYETLGAKIGKSRASVARAVAQLLELKIFTHKRGHPGQANRYWPSWNSYPKAIRDKSLTDKSLTNGATRVSSVRLLEESHPCDSIPSFFPKGEEEGEVGSAVPPLPNGRGRQASPEACSDAAAAAGVSGNNEIADTRPGEAGSAESEPAPAEAAEDFERFWKAYPKQERKREALVEYNATLATGIVTPQRLIDAARQYAKAKRGAEPRHVKFPDNWLREKRWLDSPQPKQKAPAPFKPTKRKKKGKRKQQPESSIGEATWLPQNLVVYLMPSLHHDGFVHVADGYGAYGEVSADQLKHIRLKNIEELDRFGTARRGNSKVELLSVPADAEFTLIAGDGGTKWIRSAELLEVEMISDPVTWNAARRQELKRAAEERQARRRREAAEAAARRIKQQKEEEALWEANRKRIDAEAAERRAKLEAERQQREAEAEARRAKEEAERQQREADEQAKLEAEEAEREPVDVAAYEAAKDALDHALGLLD